MTLPVPLPVNSILSLDNFAFTTLSVIIVPDDDSVLSPIDKELKVPAAGVVPPITTLSTEPPSKSIDPKTIFPVPLASNSKFELDFVTLITLSVKLKLESIVRFETFTTPVPPGDNLRLAFELVDIMLSFMVMLSIGTGAANVVEPVDVRLPKVESPDTSNVPVVDKFSLPKLMAPDESVMDPSASVKLPNVDPVAEVNVPVLVKFSLPKLIAPDESVIDPFASVIFPIADPVAPEIVPVMVAVPSTLIVPSTDKFSLILMIVESSELKVVPENPTPAILIFPEPLGTILMSSFVRTVLILLSFILIPGNTMVPVPLGLSTKSAFDDFVAILLPLNVISDFTVSKSNTSVKLSFSLLPAILIVSPVPSLPADPTSIIFWAISTNI